MPAMHYIVLDLEWNQSPTGKSGEVPHLPFEIIEIGAVRLNESFEVIDRFQEVIHPSVYLSLHHKTREIISLRSIDLENARSFPAVVFDFLSWCGESPVFCTWGPSDLKELQRNMVYHQIALPFPFPFLYYDIQKIFSIVYEDRKSRRSLEYAVDFLQIVKEVPFHSALSDAHYTALIMQHLTAAQILRNSSVDYFRTPDSRRREIHLQYETYSKFVSRAFFSRSQAMKDRIVTSTPCYLCGRTAPKKIRWFATGSKNYLCLAFCEQHGLLKGKIRIRQREDGKFYAVKTIRQITEAEAAELRERKEIHQIRKKFAAARTEESE